MKFEMPKMNVEEFEIVDVIMTSIEECPENDQTGEDF